MPEPDAPRLFSSEFFARLDAGDADGLVALFAPNVQLMDETSAGWLRGLDAVERSFRQVMDAAMLFASRLEDAVVYRWDDELVLETFVLRQVYVLHGVGAEIVAPTSMILRFDGVDWRLELCHSVPDAGVELQG